MKSLCILTDFYYNVDVFEYDPEKVSHDYITHR